MSVDYTANIHGREGGKEGESERGRAGGRVLQRGGRVRGGERGNE